MNIFLSYASEDILIAEKIRMALLGDDHEVFFDKSSLREGGEYNSSIANAINDSDAYIFLISPNSVRNDRYVLTELKLAKKKWPKPWNYVLPVMITPTDLKVIDPYLASVTFLQPVGNIEAEVADAIRNLKQSENSRYKGNAIGHLFGEYFFYLINAVTLKGIWFQPSEIEADNKRKALTLNPKQLLFVVFNLLVGVSLVSTIKEIQFADLAPYFITAIVLWILWSFLGYVISRVLGLGNLTFLNSLALSLQTYGVVYVLSGLVTVLVVTFKLLAFDDVLLIFIIVQLCLLIIYLPVAYLKYYKYRYKIQPIIAGLLVSLIYAGMNEEIVSSSNAPMTYSPTPTVNILAIDASSIPKGQTANYLLAGEDYKNISSIVVLSDSITSIDTRDGTEKIDSFLNQVRFNKHVNFNKLAPVLTEGLPVSVLHIYSTFDWVKSDSNIHFYCDTIVAHVLLADSMKLKEFGQIKNYVDAAFGKDHFAYDSLILVPQILQVTKKNVKQ